MLGKGQSEAVLHLCWNQIKLNINFTSFKIFFKDFNVTADTKLVKKQVGLFSMGLQILIYSNTKNSLDKMQLKMKYTHDNLLQPKRTPTNVTNFRDKIQYLI